MTHLSCECGATIHIHVPDSDTRTVAAIEDAFAIIHQTHESVSLLEARYVRDSERKRNKWTQRRQHA